MGVAKKKIESERLSQQPRQRSSCALLVATMLVVCGGTGCANRRPPKPPTLRLPQPPHGLTAERVGNTVTLHWTTRPKTTDGDVVRGTVTAVVCRDDAPKAPPASPIYPIPPDPCKKVAQVTVAPGDSEAKDVLPAKLTVGPPSLIAYRVQLLNDRGRGAERSEPVYTVAGTAPAATSAIQIEQRRNAVVVAWHAVPGEPSVMQVTRTLRATASGPVPNQAPTKAPQKQNRPTSTNPEQIVLVAEGLVNGEDPGGITDRSIHDGDTVTYSAQRVMTVHLAVPPLQSPQATEKSKPNRPDLRPFILRGEPSPAVTLTFHDVIPPSAPGGLVAVAGGGFGEPLSIDLSWDANPELDVAGYNVYRAQADSTRFDRLNASMVSGLAFQDAKVEAGKTYRYRVTAVDVRGHESEPGAVVPAVVKP